MTSREPRWTRSPRARAAAAGLAILLGVALPGARAGAETSAPALYQWTDERGNVRYTPDPDRVPSSQRGTMQRLEPGGLPPSAPPRPAVQPSQVPAPSAVVSPAPPAPSAPPVPVATPAPIAAPVPGPAEVSNPALTAPAALIPAPPPVSTPAAASTPAPAGVANATPRGEADSAPEPAPAPAAGDAAREQQLVAAIADGEAPLADSAQLREIARRLPELQAELSALRERRTPPAGP